MLWIISLIVLVFFCVLCGVIAKYFDSEVASYISITLGAFAVVPLVATVIYIGSFVDSNAYYQRQEFEKEQIVQKGKIISVDNSSVMNEWVKKAQEFNKNLNDEKIVIKNYGNTFRYHNKKFLDMELIDIDTTINTMTIKVIK